VNPDRPLRAIYLGPCLARGGAEIWLTDLLRFLDPGRLQVLRVVVTDPNWIERGYANGFPVPVEAGAEAVARAVDGCDVLLSWGVQLGPLLDGRRPPLSVFIAHGDGWFTRDLVAANAGHLDHVVAVSGRVRDLACNGTPVTVIQNGVDTARLAWTLPREEVRRGLGFGPGDFVLGYLGRLAPEKHVDLILRAVATLPDRFKALVVGWGPMLPDLQDLADLHLPGRACFVTASEYLGDYYRAMDAFCTPSDSEGTPLTMLEAMHCEVPALVTPVGAVPELIEDRVNGLVISQDPGSISTAATLLAENPHWSRGLAAQGRATADRTGHASRVARDLEQLLTRLWLDKFGGAAPDPSPR
jgi:glycosyltransferase involved in cell wall biosynthesis